jgi:hemerythrin HHE cation binding domain-containing protein
MRRQGVAKRASRKKAVKRSTAKAGPKKSAKRTTARRSKKASPEKRTAAKRAATKTKKKTIGRRKTAVRAAASRSARKHPTAEPSKLASAAATVRGVVAGAVAAVADRLPWTSGDLDAIAFLEKDHRRFEDLLKQGQDTTERAVKGRTELLNTLTALLNVHELIEEKILYPALKAHPEAKDIVLEGYQEHHVADLIVNELHALPKDDEKWGAKFKVLKESIEHHIKEEEGEMFRTARGLFSRDDLQQMGARMARMKAEAL